jgi:hypothetical protein
MIDATALNDFRLCPELYRLCHAKGLVRPGRDEAPASGAAWHEAKKVWFNDEGFERALETLRQAWGEEPPILEGVKQKRPLSLFEMLLEVYCEKYPRENDPFEVVRDEEYVEATIEDSNPVFVQHYPFDYCAIVDRIIHMNGLNYAMDSKTTSAWLNDNYFQNFEISQQMLGQVALELVNGRECAGYYIDAVHVDTRYHKAKPDNCVRFGPIQAPDWRLSEWARMTEATIKRIEWFKENVGPDDVWERHDMACFKWNRPCQFFYAVGGKFPGICREAPELREDLMSEYEISFWNPKERK